MMADPYDDAQVRKKAIFDSMSPRRQKQILKRGYERWDPFILPNDPIDIRKDRTNRTSQSLIREFMQTVDPEKYNNEYGKGAFELCLGIINQDDRYLGMFDFAQWYAGVIRNADAGSSEKE